MCTTPLSPWCTSAPAARSAGCGSTSPCTCCAQASGNRVLRGQAGRACVGGAGERVCGAGGGRQAACWALKWAVLGNPGSVHHALRPPGAGSPSRVARRETRRDSAGVRGGQVPVHLSHAQMGPVSHQSALRRPTPRRRRQRSSPPRPALGSRGSRAMEGSQPPHASGGAGPRALAPPRVRGSARALAAAPCSAAWALGPPPHGWGPPQRRPVNGGRVGGPPGPCRPPYPALHGLRSPNPVDSRAAGVRARQGAHLRAREGGWTACMGAAAAAPPLARSVCPSPAFPAPLPACCCPPALPQHAQGCPGQC